MLHSKFSTLDILYNKRHQELKQPKGGFKRQKMIQLLRLLNFHRDLKYTVNQTNQICLSVCKISLLTAVLGCSDHDILTHRAAKQSKLDFTPNQLMTFGCILICTLECNHCKTIRDEQSCDSNVLQLCSSQCTLWQLKQEGKSEFQCPTYKQ